MIRQNVTPRPPAAEDLTHIVDGDGITSRRFIPLERNVGAVGYISNPSPPTLGPAYEEPWGDQRPTRADFRVGYNPAYGAWSEDHNLGWRAGVPVHPTYLQHIANVEPDGRVEATNDREYVASGRVPWDRDIQHPSIGHSFRI